MIVFCKKSSILGYYTRYLGLKVNFKSSMVCQLFAKTPVGPQIFNGYPSFESVKMPQCSGFITTKLSPCGRFIAISSGCSVVLYKGCQFEEKILELELNDAYDLEFSPSGTYLCTWQRPHIDDETHENVKIWFLNEDEPSSTTPRYQYQASTQNSWPLQFSKLDNFAIKRFGKELRIVKLDQLSPEFNFEKPYARLVPDGQISTYLISPVEHPTICIFSAEKGGKPAQLTIYPITEGIIQKKIVTRTFFKADSCQLKWNALGNAVLCMAITDFDASNKSYYGENTLYLMFFQGVNGALGGESVRVSLDKQGPIHDFTWSPTSRQFGVVYGFMPATITFFDLRGNSVYTLTEQRKNTMIYSPTSRYILIAGFGNLQGSVEILDCQDKYKCISKFDASNTSTCKWSPGCDFILTATTSPRLRVDNSIKVWHISGNLCFINQYSELLEASWRNPCRFKCKSPSSHVILNWNTNKLLDFPCSKDPVISVSQLEIHPSVASYSQSSKNMGNGNKSSKLVGAYKPPHARRVIASGNSVSGLDLKNTVPGMAPKETNSVAKNRKKRENSKKLSLLESDANAANASNNTSIRPKEPKVSKESSPEEKKIRSLLKKLRAIETLRQRKAIGDKLEDTQILKIENEHKVLQELDFLGWKP